MGVLRVEIDVAVIENDAVESSISVEDGFRLESRRIDVESQRARRESGVNRARIVGGESTLYREVRAVESRAAAPVGDVVPAPRSRGVERGLFYGQIFGGNKC